MNPQSPLGVALLAAGPWAVVLGVVFLWRLVRPELPPAEAAAPAEDLDEDPEPGPLADDFTDSVPFDTGVAVGPAAEWGDS